MFKSILVPLDLADTDLARPAIETAVTLGIEAAMSRFNP